MLNKHTYRSWFWFVHDGVLWSGCLTIALLYRFGGQPPAVEWEYLWRFLPLSGAAILYGLFRQGVYRQELSNDWVWRDIWWGWTVGMGVSMAILFGLQIPFSRLVFGAASVIFLALAVIDRIVVRRIRALLSSSSPTQVTGVGFDGDEREELDSRLKGDNQYYWIEGTKLDASFDELTDRRPDILIVHPESLSHEQLRDLFDFGSRFQVPVRLYPNPRSLFLSRTSDESWNGVRLLRSEAHHRFQQEMAVKTLFDTIASAILVVVFLPLLILISAAIYLFDGRPIFYEQQRVGRGGQLFDMYKFRTMVEGAEEEGPEITDGPGDPRITSLGRFLRRWSLDELPQLFNILKGEMSLVGPRPEVPDITEDYSPEQRRVLWIKPGLTGLSQVSGRERLELDRKLEIDQIYLTDYSIGLDLWILLKTLIVVLRGEGTN